MPTKDCLRLYVAVPEYWCDYKQSHGLEVPMSPIYAYLERNFVEGHIPGLSTSRDTCFLWQSRTILHGVDGISNLRVSFM